MKHPVRLLIIQGLLLIWVGVAFAQPMVTIHFDLDKSADKSPVGPWTGVRIGELGTAYICVEQADIVVGGASFRILHSGGFMVINPSTVPGVSIGDMFGDGIEIGINDPIPQFGADKVVIASFDFIAFDLTVSEFLVAPHSSYPTIEVARSDGVVLEATGWSATAETYIRPTIGVFFDEAGTTTDGSFNGGAGEVVPAWLMITDTEVDIEAVYLSLDLPEGVGLEGVSLAPGVNLLNGDLLGGIILGFDAPITFASGTMGLLAELTLSPGLQIINGQEITIGGDGMWSYTSPSVYAGGWRNYNCLPLITTISVPVETHHTTWGGVKAVYR